MFYKKNIDLIVKELNTDLNRGLTKKEAAIRLLKFGPNLLPAPVKPSLLLKFFEQFKNLLVIILIIASLVSLILGDTTDALAIFAIVILNAGIGFLQELKAEKTLELLKEKDTLFALVLREGTKHEIPASEIVKGDILLLEEGEKIPGDARLFEEYALTVDESVLTGESLPVTKNLDDIRKDVPLGDRLNMVYREGKITSGRGKAIVVGTGQDSEIGKIAKSLTDSVSEKTPLTQELEKVGKNLSVIIGVIAVIVFTLNILDEIPFVESLLVSISLAVAAIPEGLPAVVTIVLSLGVKRLAEKKSIIKNLPSVETLGAVRIIATDKTGTLTQNKINVVHVFLPDLSSFSVTGKGYFPTGSFINKSNKKIAPLENIPLIRLLSSASLANNASVTPKGSREPKVIGDTTEAALLVASLRAGLDLDLLSRENKRVFESPFTSVRKMMSVVVLSANQYQLYAKGAPEVILEKCNLSQNLKNQILEKNVELAKKGLRSLVIATREISKKELNQTIKTDVINEKNMQFLGIMAMQDPLRPEIKNSIALAKKAGIRTIMITGDHKETALSIAVEAGIANANSRVLTELEVEKMHQATLTKAISEGVSVFARISPLGKLKIVTSIKKMPNVQLAVTGDGVNDAPALKAAHIGIAMGKTGTDLTREVADMVITDDNYTTIIDAVREGRIIFANLVKFTRYLISCNLSEVLVVCLGVLASVPIPLMPIQILWINLVTDGFPALALGMEPAERDVMDMPPRDLKDGILHKKRWAYMLIEGTIIGFAVFFLFIFALHRFDYRQAQTMAFTTLAFAQLVHAFNNRSTRKSVFEIGIGKNSYLVWAVLISVVLQFFVVHSELGNSIFKTVSLDIYSWIYVIFFSFIPLVVVEVKKQLRFRILP